MIDMQWIKTFQSWTEIKVNLNLDMLGIIQKQHFSFASKAKFDVCHGYYLNEINVDWIRYQSNAAHLRLRLADIDLSKCRHPVNEGGLKRLKYSLLFKWLISELKYNPIRWTSEVMSKLLNQVS